MRVFDRIDPTTLTETRQIVETWRKEYNYGPYYPIWLCA